MSKLPPYNTFTTAVLGNINSHSLVILFFAEAAYGNPVIIINDPITSLSYVMVLGGAITVEACIVTLLLLFFDMSLKPLFWALFFGNLALYFVVFLPLLEFLPNLWMAEVLIVAADGAMIKGLSLHEIFQENDFKAVKWRYALPIAMLGNSLSYCVGAAMQ